MPANIEIKARLANVEQAHAIARRLSGGEPEILRQADHFYAAPQGRLKLRMFDETRGELILYSRADESGPKRSNYEIAHTSDPRVLHNILQRVLGGAGTVKKARSLYLAGQSRIHLDEVEGLGDFLEIEVVLRPGQTDEDGAGVAQSLMREFGITERELVRTAYVDLLSGR